MFGQTRPARRRNISLNRTENCPNIQYDFAIVRTPNTQGDLESVALLFGRITALRQKGGHERPTSGEKNDDGAPLDAHVRVVMRMMKERLASLTEAPLQASS